MLKMVTKDDTIKELKMVKKEIFEKKNFWIWNCCIFFISLVIFTIWYAPQIQIISGVFTIYTFLKVLEP